MKLPIILLLLLFYTGTKAQVFPIQIHVQLTPPYSPYLSDYTTPGAQKIMVHIRTNDITLSNYLCKLRITIEGVGITITTKQNFIPLPLTLLGGGTPQLFYGADLAEYFNPNALDFAGITTSQYEKNARLPEGLYRFTVEVLDYNRSTVVSNKAIAMAWIIINDPPLLNLPRNNTIIKRFDPININFSWTPRHTGSPNAAFSTDYIFRLVELGNEYQNPYDAFLTQSPLYEITTTQHQLLYGLNEPALLPGRKYAWQVEARDTEGRDLFKNKGRSEVFIFQYGQALPVPQNFKMRWAKPTTLAIRWDTVIHEQDEIKYRLQYRPRKRRENHPWYETRTKFTQKTLYHLQPDTEYEMKVRTEKPEQVSDYTEIRIFKTLSPKAFVCNDNVKPPPLPDNTFPVFPLSVNDTIHAGGYEVLVRDVVEITGKYFGSGVAIVPWLNSAKVRVTFENINVNNLFWLKAGTINSLWTADSKFLLDTETPINPGNAPQAGVLDITLVAVDSLITVTGMAIASVTKDEAGNIIISTTDSKEQTLPPGESYAIVDKVGNGYIVDKEGNIAKTTATQATTAVQRGKRNYQLSLRFEKGAGNFGFDEKKFDAFSKHYQQLSDGSYVAWKALSSAESDEINAHLQSSEVDAGKIRFEAGSTPLIPVSSADNTFQLYLPGRVQGMQEELLALYSPTDSLPDQVLGKINLISYNALQYNVVIVPVNQGSIPTGATLETISKKLNGVFGQAVVDWKVTMSKSISVALDETFDEGGGGLYSNYTADMKKVLKVFGRLQDNTYYLFLIDKPKDPSTLGYMPRNKQAGFIFIEPHRGDTEEFLKTIAHELGHGAFNLKHTFSEHAIAPGTTDNVMDYSNGTALYKYQWDYIHDPQAMIGLFEGGEESAMVGMTEEQIATFWEQLPPYKKAAEILQEHLEDSKVYENIQLACDNAKCIITADLKIAEDITYTMEVTLLSTMNADELISMLMSEYRVDLWDAFNVKSENIWDELYHWWRNQNDDLAQQKGWQVSTLNFLADVITAPTLYPAVSGWATGKHWRDGHNLAGWEQALSALDFLVAEEMVKGCITNFVVRVGGKTVSLLRLKEGTKYLLQKSIEKGLKFAILSNDEVTILSKEGRVVGKIAGDVLEIPYSKYGGDIVCIPNKTTTLIGKYEDIVHGDGITIIKENKLYKYGENVGGVNILDDANWNWPTNENWLREAVQRGDVIRVISDPTNMKNLFRTNSVGQFIDDLQEPISNLSADPIDLKKQLLAKGIITPFGMEVQLLESLGKVFDSLTFVFL